MQPQEYNDLADKIWSDLKVIRDKKSHDYATDSDTLKNFKVTSQILAGLGYQVKGEEIKASDVAMFFEVIKLCRRANLRGRQPDNESVLDSVEDNVNYTCLQYACLVDEDKLRIEPLTTEEIHKELRFKFEPCPEDEWINGYGRWVGSNSNSNGVIHVERQNWKVKGLLEIGRTYQCAKDSSIKYTFLGQEKESGLYRLLSNIDGHDLYYTEQGLDMLDLVEVPNV